MTDSTFVKTQSLSHVRVLDHVTRAAVHQAALTCKLVKIFLFCIKRESNKAKKHNIRSDLTRFFTRY